MRDLSRVLLHKYYLLLLGVLALAISLASGNPQDKSIEEYILPKNKYTGITKIDKDLVFDNIRITPLAYMSEMGIKKVANAMYYFSEEAMLDVRIYLFEDQASLVDIFEQRRQNWLDEGKAVKTNLAVGEDAYYVTNPDMASGYLGFYVGRVDVTITYLFGDVDVVKFAKIYAEWLAGFNELSAN